MIVYKTREIISLWKLNIEAKNKKNLNCSSRRTSRRYDRGYVVSAIYARFTAAKF